MSETVHDEDTILLSAQANKVRNRLLTICIGWLAFRLAGTSPTCIFDKYLSSVDSLGAHQLACRLGFLLVYWIWRFWQLAPQKADKQNDYQDVLRNHLQSSGRLDKAILEKSTYGQDEPNTTRVCRTTKDGWEWQEGTPGVTETYLRSTGGAEIELRSPNGDFVSSSTGGPTDATVFPTRREKIIAEIIFSWKHPWFAEITFPLLFGGIVLCLHIIALFSAAFKLTVSGC